MKFVISSNVLSSRLALVGRVIVAKNNLPILGSFLFEIQGTTLKVTASDNETTLCTTMQLAECDADIRFVANAKTVQDAIREIPEQPLEFFVNETTLEVTVEYRNGNYNFMAQPADEYPTPSTLPTDAARVSIAPDKLLDAVTRAIIATADDALRPVMNGIFFDIHHTHTAVVASNGQKLACTTFTEMPSSEEGSFILPKKPALMLKNILTKAEEDVVIVFDGKNAEAHTGEFDMSCRLIDGRYPNYESVIPRDNPNCATVNREALISALRRVLIFSSAISSLVKFRVENSKITVSSQDTNYAMSAQESLLCEYSGNPLTIGFKGPFLIELLNNLPGEDVILKLGDMSRAGIMVPTEQQNGEEALMLLMPIMLNE